MEKLDLEIEALDESMCVKNQKIKISKRKNNIKLKFINIDASTIF